MRHAYLASLVVLGVVFGVIVTHVVAPPKAATVTAGGIGTAASLPNSATVPACPPVRVNGNLRTRYRLYTNGLDAGCRFVGAKP